MVGKAKDVKSGRRGMRDGQGPVPGGCGKLGTQGIIYKECGGARKRVVLDARIDPVKFQSFFT